MSEPARRRSILRGITLVGRFRAEGFAEFEATRQGFLNSLAPPLALMLVACLLLALRYGVGPALQLLLIFVVALLGPIVIGEAMAQRIGRGPHWLRYAVAFNWCQWAIPVAGILVILGATVLAMSGFPQALVQRLVSAAIFGYALALYLFVARHGLSLGWGPAIAFVAAMHIGGGLLLMVPEFLANLLS